MVGRRPAASAARGNRPSGRTAAAAPTSHRITHTGWYHGPTGHWRFLHGTGAIGATGPTTELRARLDGRLAAYTLPTLPAEPEIGGGVAVAVDSFLNAADRNVTLPLLAAIARAPLGTPAPYVVHLAGQTGSGKTSLARLAVAWYGPELSRPDAPTLSWAGSANAIEAALCDARDVVVLVDDYLGGTAHERTADRLVRSTSGVVRDRLRADLTARPSFSPGGLIISTGEDSFGRVSAQARTLTITCAPSMRAPADRFRAAQDAARDGLYATVMAAYVRHLAARRDRHGTDTDNMPWHWSRDLATVRAKIDAYVARLGVDVYPRAVENVVDLITAFSRFISWTVPVGAYTAAAAKRLVDETRTVLLALLDEHVFDEATQAVELLRDALAAGRCHVTTYDGLPPTDAHLYGWTKLGGFSDPRPHGPCLGYLHRDTIDLLPDTLVTVLRDAQRRVGTEPNLTRTRLARLLNARSWLEKNEGRGTYGTRRRIGKPQVPVWPLSVSVLYPDTSAPEHDPESVQAVHDLQATFPGA